MEPDADAPSFLGDFLTGRRRVLIVDDAEPVQRKLCAMLARVGILPSDIQVASDPEETLAAMLPRPPDIVFMEFLGVQPDEGLDLIHDVLRRAPDARVILVTAEPMAGPEVRAALRAGIFAYMEKPVRLDKLQLIMHEIEADEGRLVRVR